MFLQKETCKNRKARIHIAIFVNFKVLYCLRVTRWKTPPAVTCCLVTAGGGFFPQRICTDCKPENNLPWILFKKQFVNHSYENPRADTRYETAKPAHSTSSVIHLYIQHRAQMHKSSFTKKKKKHTLWEIAVKQERKRQFCMLIVIRRVRPIWWNILPLQGNDKRHLQIRFKRVT